MVPDGTLTKPEWHQKFPYFDYGIAYGLDEIQHALNTQDKVKPLLESLERTTLDQTRAFIRDSYERVGLSFSDHEIPAPGSVPFKSVYKSGIRPRSLLNTLEVLGYQAGGYCEEERRGASNSLSGEFQRFEITGIHQIHLEPEQSLRIDLGNKSGSLELKSLSLVDQDQGTSLWSWEAAGIGVPGPFTTSKHAKDLDGPGTDSSRLLFLTGSNPSLFLKPEITAGLKTLENRLPPCSLQVEARLLPLEESYRQLAALAFRKSSEITFDTKAVLKKAEAELQSAAQTLTSLRENFCCARGFEPGASNPSNPH